MDLYLTPERFSQMGLGVSLDDLEPVEIRSILRSASARVDTYCNVPALPQPHSFKGGTIVGEEHDWSVGDGLYVPAQRRLYLRHYPVKEVSQLVIQVTNQQGVTFQPTELFVSPQLGVVEIVSLVMTASGLFGAFVVPNIGLAKPRAKIDYTYGYNFTATDEVLEPTDGLTYSAQNQFWTDAEVTVKVDGVTVTNGFTIDRTEGRIVFAAAQGAEQVVTASYSYPLPPAIQTATAYIAADMIGQRKHYQRGMVGIRRLAVGEITIERDMPRRGEQAIAQTVPPEAARDLANYVFMRAA